jgi:hypothetical protein
MLFSTVISDNLESLLNFLAAWIKNVPSLEQRTAARERQLLLQWLTENAFVTSGNSVLRSEAIYYYSTSQILLHIYSSVQYITENALFRDTKFAFLFLF